MRHHDIRPLLASVGVVLAMSGCGKHEPAFAEQQAKVQIVVAPTDGPYGPQHRDEALALAKKLARSSSDLVDVGHPSMLFTEVSLPPTATDRATGPVAMNGWCVTFPMASQDREEPDAAAHPPVDVIRLTPGSSPATGSPSTRQMAQRRKGPATFTSPVSPGSPVPAAPPGPEENQPQAAPGILPPAPDEDPGENAKRQQLQVMEFVAGRPPMLPPQGIDPKGDITTSPADQDLAQTNGRSARSCVVLIAMDGRTSVSVPR